MLLCKLVLKTLKSELDGLGYSNYLYIAPQSASYPFVTYFPIANEIEYTFGQVIEDVNIQLSIFVAQANVADMLDMAQAIEETFDEIQASEGGYDIFCTHRTNEQGPRYLEKEHYWQMDIEFTFQCERSKV